MSQYNVPDKSAGDEWPSAEHNLLKNAHNDTDSRLGVTEGDVTNLQSDNIQLNADIMDVRDALNSHLNVSLEESGATANPASTDAPEGVILGTFDFPVTGDYTLKYQVDGNIGGHGLVVAQSFAGSTAAQIANVANPTFAATSATDQLVSPATVREYTVSISTPGPREIGVYSTGGSSASAHSVMLTPPTSDIVPTSKLSRELATWAQGNQIIITEPKVVEGVEVISISDNSTTANRSINKTYDLPIGESRFVKLKVRLNSTNTTSMMLRAALPSVTSEFIVDLSTGDTNVDQNGFGVAPTVLSAHVTRTTGEYIVEFPPLAGATVWQLFPSVGPNGITNRTGFDVASTGEVLIECLETSVLPPVTNQEDAIEVSLDGNTFNLPTAVDGEVHNFTVAALPLDIQSTEPSDIENLSGIEVGDQLVALPTNFDVPTFGVAAEQPNGQPDTVFWTISSNVVLGRSGDGHFYNQAAGQSNDQSGNVTNTLWRNDTVTNPTSMQGSYSGSIGQNITTPEYQNVFITDTVDGTEYGPFRFTNWQGGGSGGGYTVEETTSVTPTQGWTIRRTTSRIDSVTGSAVNNSDPRNPVIDTPESLNFLSGFDNQLAEVTEELRNGVPVVCVADTGETFASIQDNAGNFAVTDLQNPGRSVYMDFTFLRSGGVGADSTFELFGLTSEFAKFTFNIESLVTSADSGTTGEDPILLSQVQTGPWVRTVVEFPSWGAIPIGIQRFRFRPAGDGGINAVREVCFRDFEIRTTNPLTVDLPAFDPSTNSTRPLSTFLLGSNTPVDVNGSPLIDINGVSYSGGIEIEFDFATGAAILVLPQSDLPYHAHAIIGARSDAESVNDDEGFTVAWVAEGTNTEVGTTLARATYDTDAEAESGVDLDLISRVEPIAGTLIDATNGPARIQLKVISENVSANVMSASLQGGWVRQYPTAQPGVEAGPPE